ncbi:MAG: hypothetical protein Q7S10_03605 [bacterium]|nr:hypothetical protein [bacterium]
MISEFQSKHKPFLLIIAIIFLAAIVVGLVLFFNTSQQEVACTMEAKVCPDGSSVGRTGPLCEFAACPSNTVIKDWNTSSDSEQGIVFLYPEKLPTTYINTLDWPPKLQVLNKPFSCVKTGNETNHIEPVITNNTTYCVSTITEGAAGSIYTQYAYAFQKASLDEEIRNKTMVLTFSLRSTQCGNYPDPQKTACDQERQSFDINAIIDQVAKTMQFINKTATNEGTITGKVWLGPTCPVIKDPPDGQCDDKPYKTSLALTSANGSNIIKQFSSDENGNFSVSVQPGTYAITNIGMGPWPSCHSDGISVEAGKITQKDVLCDTGIR